MGLTSLLRVSIRNKSAFTGLTTLGSMAGDFESLNDQFGLYLVSMAREKLSGYLTPKQSFNVGATGDAAGNFLTEKQGNTWSVVEGDRVKHNYFIRHGFSGTAKGKHIPIENLRLWAAAKGITINPPGKDGMGMGGKYTRVKGSEKRKPYIRAVKNRKAADRGLYALRAYLEQHGSKYSTWNFLHPEGEGKFDYAEYLGYRDPVWRQTLNQAQEEIVGVYLKVLTSDGQIRRRTFRRKV